MGIITGVIVVIIISVLAIWKLISTGIKKRNIMCIITALIIGASLTGLIVYIAQLFQIFLLAPGSEFH